MPVNVENYQQLVKEIGPGKILVAVSKTKPVSDIQELYNIGHRDFGENYVQELVEKAAVLPPDIRWHFIGHLQANKSKKIVPFVHMIQGVDSIGILKEIEKKARKKNREILCLLQVHIADESSKFGFFETELEELTAKWEELGFEHVKISGMMGMATLTEDTEKIRKEFRYLKSLFDKYKNFTPWKETFTILSTGMSSDYRVALDEGSNLIRVGSLIFGERDKQDNLQLH